MTTEATTTGRPGYLQVLRECRDFRLLFTARVISMLGDWLALVAVIALIREVAGSSPKAVGGLLILKLLPIFLAGPLAGVVADRFSRRRIMIGTDLLRSVLVLAMLAAPFTPWPIELVLALTLVQVTGSAFFEPARSAILPQLVPGHYLSTASALGAVMWSMVFALGAALGGVMTDLLGWRIVLTIDAASYVVSAVLVARIVAPTTEKRPPGPLDWQTVTGLRDFREGLRFIAGRRDVATVIFAKSGWGIAGAVTLFLTLFGERVYAIGGRPDLGVSLLYVARAIGTGVGPVLARRLVPAETPPNMRRLIAVSLLWPALWYAVFSWVNHPLSAAACVILAHFGGSVLWVYSTVLLQRIVPDEFRGRVLSTDLGLATLTISASIFIYGQLIALPGSDLRTLVRWMSLSLVIPTAIWLVASAKWSWGQR